MTPDRRPGSAPTAGTDAKSARPLDRRLAILSAVATILPLWIAAVRVGLGELVAVGDTAIMALRAPDTVSTHPTLIGMPASSASSASHVLHFPGPWELWWLALPVKALGPTWGMALAMAALNSLWILLAIWLVWRNLRTASALVAIAFIGAFCWSIGNGVLIDARPLLMVLVPFLTVVIAAWCCAAGDRTALIVLAAAANYVWLDHLVLALAVPVVVFVGCAGLAVGHLRANRHDPRRQSERRRKLYRSVGVATVITLVFWLPTLIQQVTGSPGNLGLLLSRSDGAAPPIRSWTAALHVMAGVLGRPPMWFRGSLHDPPFLRVHHSGFAIGSATWADAATLVVVLGGLGVSFVVAWRRRDRVAFALVATSGASIGAMLATVYLAPETTALVPEYLFPAWVAALTWWLALAVTALHTPRWRESAAVAWAGAAAAVAFGAFNVPMSHTGWTARPEVNALARDASASVVGVVHPGERVAVAMPNAFADADFLSAVLVALHQRDIAFCFPAPNTSLYRFIPDCGTSPTTAADATILLADQPGGVAPAGAVIFHRRIFPTGTTDTALDRRVHTWLAGRSSLRVNAAARRPALGPLVPNLLEAQVPTLLPRDGNLGHLVDDPTFQWMIITWWRRGDTRDARLFEDQPLSPDELYAWAVARQRGTFALWVTKQ